MRYLLYCDNRPKAKMDYLRNCGSLENDESCENHQAYVEIEFGYLGNQFPKSISQLCPLQPNCSEQILRLEDIHDPIHSVHCDQFAKNNTQLNIV